MDWQRADRPRIVDLDGSTPTIRIPGARAKGGRDEHFPIQPDACAYLRRWPIQRRRGRVFRVDTRHGPLHDSHAIGKVISEIGEAARIRTGTRRRKDPTTGKRIEVPKWASAHDLRRSFGSRWAPRLKPRVLQLLMGHKSYQTTQEYYEEIDVEDVAKSLWREFGDQCSGVRTDKGETSRKPVNGHRQRQKPRNG